MLCEQPPGAIAVADDGPARIREPRDRP